MKQRRIGILVTNTDESDFARRNPPDGEKFTTLMRAVRPDWQYEVYDCTKGEFPRNMDECDGYIIGGSPASVNDSRPWISRLMDFIRELHAARKPTVGCCFGHQAIAKALGGSVGKNPGGWGFGVEPTHFAELKSSMQPPDKTLNLYAAHGEQVTRLPPEAKVIGSSTFCPIGFFMVGEHFFTTEYHPEMSATFFEGLTRAFEKHIGKDIAAQTREQAKAPADGLKFAAWMTNFLEMGA